MLTRDHPFWSWLSRQYSFHIFVCVFFLLTILFLSWAQGQNELANAPNFRWIEQRNIYFLRNSFFNIFTNGLNVINTECACFFRWFCGSFPVIFTSWTAFLFELWLQEELTFCFKKKTKFARRYKLNMFLLRARKFYDKSLDSHVILQVAKKFRFLVSVQALRQNYSFHGKKIISFLHKHIIYQRQCFSGATQAGLNFIQSDLILLKNLTKKVIKLKDLQISSRLTLVRRRWNYRRTSEPTENWKLK